MPIVTDQDIPADWYDLYTTWFEEARALGEVRRIHPMTMGRRPSPAQVLWREFFRNGTICFEAQDNASRAAWYAHQQANWPGLYYYNVFMMCWLLGPYNGGNGQCPPSYCMPVKCRATPHEVYATWPPGVTKPTISYWLQADEDWSLFTQVTCAESCPLVTLPCPPVEDGLTWQVRATPGIDSNPDYLYAYFRCWSPCGGVALDPQTLQFTDKPSDTYNWNHFYTIRYWQPYPTRFTLTCQIFDTTGQGRPNCDGELWREHYAVPPGAWHWVKLFNFSSRNRGLCFTRNSTVYQPGSPTNCMPRTKFQIRLTNPPAGYTWNDAWSDCGGVKISDQILELDITVGGLYATNFFELTPT